MIPTSIADHRAHPGSTTRFFLPFRLTKTGRVQTSHSGIGEESWSVRRCAGVSVDRSVGGRR